MGSLPDSKYIIKADGYWFVEAHDVDPSKGYISVSAKGIINGLSNQPNDGADFGPDTYNPSSTASIPYTYTSGIQEAIDYAYTQNDTSIKLLSGLYDITNAPWITPPKAGTSYGVCKIYIPYRLYSDSPLLIKIQGEYGGKPWYYQLNEGATSNFVPPNTTSGVIIQDLTSSNPATGKTASIFLVDYDRSATNEQKKFSNTQLDISNIDIRLNSPPYSNGFDFSYCSGITANNIANTVDHVNGTISQPAIGVSEDIGIIMPFYENAGKSVLNGAYVEGQYTGLLTSSHFIGDKIFVQYCYQGIQFYSGAHPQHITYIDIENSNYILSADDNFSIGSIVVNVDVLDMQVMENVSGWYTFKGFTSVTVPATEFNGFANILYNGLIGGTGGNHPFDDFGSTIQYLPYFKLKSLTPTIGSYGFSSLNLSANPPVSGTVYQNLTGTDILIYLPVYTSTSGTAGNVKASIGASSSSLTQVVNDIVNSGTSSSNPRTITLKVPAGWYYEFTGTTTTFGTAIVVAD